MKTTIEITEYNFAKGYGFAVDDKGNDVFFKDTSFLTHEGRARARKGTRYRADVVYNTGIFNSAYNIEEKEQ